MKELLQLAWDALLFKHTAYTQHVARADALKRGLILLVLVTLLGGVISLIINVVDDLQPMNLEAQRRKTEQAFQGFFRSWEPYLDLPPDFDPDAILALLRPGMETGFRIAQLPTRLPRPVGTLLESLGGFLSLPFGRLAGWLGYAIWVLLIAKLLGGRATVAQMLGVTLLYVVPHFLDFLGFVPCLGPVLWVVATVWGIAIYVKAVAVANDFGIERAIAATAIPALAGMVLALLGLLVTLIPILMSSR